MIGHTHPSENALLVRRIGSERVQRILDLTAYAIVQLRRSESPGQLSSDLALLWHKRLGPTERYFLLCVAVQAAEASDLQAIVDLLRRDRGSRDESASYPQNALAVSYARSAKQRGELSSVTGAIHAR